MKQEPLGGILEIERLGGLAGFGGPTGRLRSVGRLELAHLQPSERQAIEALLKDASATPSGAPTHPDGFRYRLKLASSAAVEVAEGSVPDFIRAAVHDELT